MLNFEGEAEGIDPDADHRRHPRAHARGPVGHDDACGHPRRQTESRAPARRRPADDDRSQLFDEEFLKKLEYLHVVSRKTFAGRLRAERRTKQGRLRHRVRRPPQVRRRRRLPLHRLERLRPHRQALAAAVRGGRGPPHLHPRRRVALDAHRQPAEAALRHAGGRGAGLHRPGQPRPGRGGAAVGQAPAGRLPPARGKRRIFKVFEFLRSVEVGGMTNLGACMDAFVHQQQAPRPGGADLRLLRPARLRGGAQRARATTSSSRSSCRCSMSARPTRRFTAT